MSDAPHKALLSIAGWEDAVCTELKGGFTNRTWMVTSGLRRGVLKIDASPRTVPYNTRIAEQRVQTAAAEAGIANQVIYASESAYLTEYAHGEVWTADDLEHEENLSHLAELMRKLHSLPLTGRCANSVNAAQMYVQKIDVTASPTAKLCLETVQRLHAPQNMCCCHNDLVAGNIIAAPELRLLDWEYACDNDPLFDLATVVAHHEMSPECAAFLLDCYFDGEGTRWRDKLDQQMRLYNALVWLWYASRPEPDPDQLSAFETRLHK